MHLDRLITILEAVAIAGRPVGAAELHRATSLPRPTCYRLLATLAGERLLEEPEDGKFQIGQRLMRIAFLGKPDQDLSQAASPALKAAAIEMGEAVFISRFRDPGVEIIHVEMPTDPARSFIYPGLGFRPMHACSCSKAIAAFADPDLAEQILNAPLRAYTPKTRTSPSDLRDEFAKIRQQGFAECVEEIEIGVASVAAPIKIEQIGAVFSVGATGPIRRFTPEYRSQMGEELQKLAGTIGHAFQLSSLTA